MNRGCSEKIKSRDGTHWKRVDCEMYNQDSGRERDHLQSLESRLLEVLSLIGMGDLQMIKINIRKRERRERSKTISTIPGLVRMHAVSCFFPRVEQFLQEMGDWKWETSDKSLFARFHQNYSNPQNDDFTNSYPSDNYFAKTTQRFSCLSLALTWK